MNQQKQSRGFGFEVLVIILTSEVINPAILYNPLMEEDCLMKNLRVTFVGKIMNPEDLEIFKEYDPSMIYLLAMKKFCCYTAQANPAKPSISTDFNEKNLKLFILSATLEQY